MAISTTLRKKIGKPMDPVVFEVEKGSIRRYATAIGETNPIHQDEAAAKAAGYASLVAPVTYPCCLQKFEETLAVLDVNTNAIMHAEEEYEYFKPIVAGDRIEITHTLVDAYEKQSPNGLLVFIVIETRGNNKSSKLVFKGRRVLVEFRR